MHLKGNSRTYLGMDLQQKLTLKYNKPVPRYTSYPTAPHFHVKIDGKMYANWLANVSNNTPVSLYVHIPFCPNLCLYCGCNTRITSNLNFMHGYCLSVVKEIKMVAKAVGKKLKVSHFQWGGGTPSYITPEDFKLISQTAKNHFDFLEDTEFSVEIDPRVLLPEMIQTFVDEGVNRVSFGVQDFKNEVQKAVNRVQPYDLTKHAVDDLRAAGVDRVNLDLMCGLPFQTVKSIEESVRLAASLNPDRLALFGYAHVPWMKKHQEVLEQYHLPDEQERYGQFMAAQNALAKAGFNTIGIDHFAKDDDALWQAKLQGTLRRNFQGYTPDNADTLIGFGASAVSCLPDGYAQNNPSTKAYEMLLADEVFPIHKGIKTDIDDILRREIIMTLMCYYKVDVGAICAAKGREISCVADAFKRLKPLVEDALITVENNVVALVEENYALARVVASCFDTYFENDGTKHAQAV